MDAEYDLKSWQMEWRDVTTVRGESQTTMASSEEPISSGGSAYTSCPESGDEL